VGQDSNKTDAAICECRSHAWRYLTKGFVALVDADDATLLHGSFHAHPSRSGVNVYAANSKRQYLHRIVLTAPINTVIDHRNGNGLDNRRSNLRLGNKSQNQSNRRKMPGKASRFKGVCYSERRKKWEARVCASYRRYLLGYYDTEEDAARAYDAGAKRVHGEFARTNESLGLLD